MSRDVERTALFGLMLILCFSGAVMVYSSTFALALSRGLDSTFFLNRHLLGIIIGLCAFLAIQKLDYSVLKRSVPFLTVLGLLLLLLVFHTTLGICYGGFSRWCRLGPLTVQPSEFSRLVLLSFLAYHLERKKSSAQSGAGSYLIPILLWAAAGSLILLEPNYGYFVEFGALFLVLLFVSGARLAPLAGVLGMFVCTAISFIFTSHYRMGRFLAFFEPYLYYKTTGYQVIQSLVGFSRGGLLGTGIGTGKQKLFYLPEIYNDYIFAVVGEELGFVGVFLTATAYLGLFLLCLRIARRAPDIFGTLFSFGAGASLTLSAFINMSVCLNLLPPTGLVLPFVSYGGSSMVASIVTVGVVHRISLEGKRP